MRSCFLAFARWLANVAWAVASVACDFPLACGRVWFLSMFEIQRRPCATLSIALGLTIVSTSLVLSTSIVQRCVYSQEWYTNFWGRKMIRMLRCECCATMRLLLDVWHVILQRCTTVARLLGTLPTSIYTLYKHRIIIEVLPALRVWWLLLRLFLRMHSDQTEFCVSYDFLIASSRAPIVKAP